MTNLKLNDIVSFKIVSHWQGKNVESWGVDNIIVLNLNDFPLEVISSCFDKLNNENKLAAFEKYFDTLSVKELAAWVADMEKVLSPAEIFHAVTDKKTFNEKFPTLVERSDKKFLWAQYFIDNRELFRLTKLCDDIMIFFMYETVKRAKNLKDLYELIKLLREKKDDIESSPRVKIIYEYICAAFAKHYANQCEAVGNVFKRDEYLNLRDKCLDEVGKSFMEIFNDFIFKVEAQADKPDENFSLPRHIAHVLPPCENEEIRCSFCEAVTWSNKDCNYCPRLNYSDKFKYCFRINPNLKLSAEDWSVIELTKKLNVLPIKDFPADHPFNREFFTRIGGEFNRIEDLLKRLKCRECGHYMRARR